MTDHSEATDHPAVPDYELDDTLALTEPAQYAAAFEDTRREIVSILLERAATTSELAEVMGKPKGTVGHHLKVLEDAGLVRVVRTKKVRALEAKYYGRTARVFLYHRIGAAATVEQKVLSTAAAEFAAVPEDTDLPLTANIRYARIPAERAEEWNERLKELLTDFADQPRGGDVVYGMAVALYPTSRRPLATEEAEE